MMLTETDLELLERLVLTATPGPWKAFLGDSQHGQASNVYEQGDFRYDADQGRYVGRYDDHIAAFMGQGEQDRDKALLLFVAREAVLILAAEVRRLRTENAQWGGGE